MFVLYSRRMIKDFSAWFVLKSKLNNVNQSNFFFKEREVWWCSLGLNVGDEQDGKNQLFNRPVLVVKKFNNNLFYGLPMSTKNKKNPYYHQIELQGRVVSIILCQLRTLDKKRLQRRLGTVHPSDFNKVCENMKKLF